MFVLPLTHVINVLDVEEIFATFNEKVSQKRNQKEIKNEKLTKRKDNILYFKQKG